ncbi:hypothetical protein [Flavobacterium selenitireducens]|uniref:hypothetical protein n=1 Tax=Flavobacterium selenitireducens TaxID=2722704 RepID=UPI00168B3A92|nr:hypothetical protein [Flavobacterium selenitireducens]MBD3583704.1 hypothetical protein [Flavobacterium selenitireducens]
MINKYYLSLLLFIGLFTACDQSDGNDRTPVEYRILAGANQVTSITFTGANGQPAQVSASDLADNWTQKIWVVKPFNASATVAFSNQTASDAEFVMQIYSRDQNLATVVDTITAMTDSTAVISAAVAN